MKDPRGLAIIVSGAVSATMEPEEVFGRERLLEWARDQDIFDIYTRSDVLTWVSEEYRPDEVYESEAVVRCAAKYGNDEDGE